MPQGIITKVIASRGFGFIRPDDGGNDIFLHCKALPFGTTFDETLQERKVTYDIEQSDKGSRAVNVQFQRGW